MSNLSPLNLHLRLLGALATLWFPGCGPASGDSSEKRLRLDGETAGQLRLEQSRGVLSPEERQRREEQSKREAVALYPELGVAGTAVNREYVRRYKLYRAINPAFFGEPDWPKRLADMLAVDLGLDPRK